MREHARTTATSSSSLHVGLVLAAFAGFTLAAALAALYLWEERRLKRRAADILRLRLPPLASLERLARRTIAVSLAAADARSRRRDRARCAQERRLASTRSRR